LTPGNFLLRNTFDGEAAVGLNNIFRRGFDEVCRDALGFFNYALGCNGQSAAADYRATTAKCPGALLAHVSVAVQYGHILRSGFHELGSNLCPGSFMPLPMGA
jgi:hypothetical protein